MWWLQGGATYDLGIILLQIAFPIDPSDVSMIYWGYLFQLRWTTQQSTSHRRSIASDRRVWSPMDNRVVDIPTTHCWVWNQCTYELWWFQQKKKRCSRGRAMLVPMNGDHEKSSLHIYARYEVGLDCCECSWPEQWVERAYLKGNNAEWVVELQEKIQFEYHECFLRTVVDHQSPLLHATERNLWATYLRKKVES